jgi:hypothetical protein
MNLQDILQRAGIIKNETVAGANTANRVGTLLELLSYGLVSSMPAENGLSNNDIGKLVQLSTGNNAEVYNETPAVEGTKGVWKLQFQGVQPNNSYFNYSNTGIVNTGNILKSNSWGNGNYGNITNTAEETIAFANYINANTSTLKLKATIANSTTVLIEETEFRLPFNNSTSNFDYQYEDFEFTVEVAAVTPIPPIANKRPLGKLLLVDYTIAYISNARIETFTASSTIESGDNLCGSIDGKVRKCFAPGDLPIGVAISNASANTNVRVLIY